MNWKQLFLLQLLCLQRKSAHWNTFFFIVTKDKKNLIATLAVNVVKIAFSKNCMVYQIWCHIYYLLHSFYMFKGLQKYYNAHFRILNRLTNLFCDSTLDLQEGFLLVLSWSWKVTKPISNRIVNFSKFPIPDLIRFPINDPIATQLFLNKIHGVNMKKG